MLFIKNSKVTEKLMSNLQKTNRMIIKFLNLILLSSNNPGTADPTSPPSGDKTDFPSWWGITTDSRRVTNMLMVTSSVGMFDGVHRYTSNLGPAVTFHTEFVVSTSSLEHGFIDTSTSSDDSDDGTVFGRIKTFVSRGEFYSGAASVEVVGDNGAITSGSLGNLTTISSFLFHRADNGSFRALSQWDNITDAQSGLFTAMNKLTSSDTFWADHGFDAFPVFVWVVELDLGEGSTTAGVMDDILDDTFDEPVAFGVVQRSEFGGAFSL